MNKKIFILLVFTVLIPFMVFSMKNSNSNANNSNIYLDYYTSNQFYVEQVTENVTLTYHKLKDSKDLNLFINFVKNVHLLTLYYVAGENVSLSFLNEVNTFILSEVKKKEYNSSGVLLETVSSYLWDRLAIEKDFSIISKLPNFYRRAIIHEGNDNLNITGLAQFYIYASNKATSVINDLISKQFSKLENLSDISRYNALINYSLFYAKNNNLSMAYNCLNKASVVFPNSFLHQILKINFDNGIYDWGEDEDEGLKFKFNYSYYGLPLKACVGLLSRNKDFSLYSNIGASFSIDKNISLDGYIDFDFSFTNFSFNLFYNHNLLSLGNNSLNNQVFNTGIRLITPFNLISTISYGNKILSLKDAKTFVQRFVSFENEFKTLLIEKGYLKSTLKLNNNLSFYPNSKVLSLKGSGEFLITRYYDLFDLSNLFSFSYEFGFLFDSNEDYLFGITQDKMTYRLPLIKDNYNRVYNFIAMDEIELRYYFLRNNNFTSNMFVSAFGNVGFGFRKNSESRFLWQTGIGVGYNFMDCANFTVQFGINQNLKPIIFLGVCSLCSHPL